MSILVNPDALALMAVEVAMKPPPPADLNRWAEDNIKFGKESWAAGQYSSDTIPQLRRILQVLSPDHPATVVSVRGAAQIFKTTVAQIFIGSRMDIDPCDMGYVHPSHDNAIRWARRKWKVMRKQSPALCRIFGEQRSRDSTDTTLYQETRDGLGSLQISGANSPASLSMVSWPAQVQDDLSKWQANDAGDPEEQSDSRSGAFEWRKVLKISTPLVKKTCRITRNFERGTQEWWHVPCPHCEHYQALKWENFQANIDREEPDESHFTCIACGSTIERKHKADILRRGRYVADNPGAREISLQASRAEMPNYDWGEIARKWLDVEGDPKAEQVYLNDWWGLPFESASEAPPWEDIRNRANGVDDAGNVVPDAPTYQRGRIPPGALLTCVGVDCQGDRIEVHIKAFGEHLRRYTVDYEIIPHFIGTDEGRAALDKVLMRTFPDAFGNMRGIDMLAIDGNAYTKDVFAWAKGHPWTKVIVVRGAKSDLAPPLALTKTERKPDGQVRKTQKRFYNVGVSALKSALYEVLRRVDPLARGFCGYPQGLDDEFYRQLTSEKRETTVDKRTGFPRSFWRKDHDRNEVLDTEIYAEAAAVRCGWYTRTAESWAAMRAEREVVNQNGQSDLFDPAREVSAHAARPSVTVTEAKKSKASIAKLLA
ncbi:phage terminase large subunit family protein [Bradyrhizobium sp. Pha-3]|uniref:phage terminase large subunit family protein n=1 Tax=Bradyrhizobium sp. Pha-3 TaxID=208375 RepID=UPI0035D4C992